MRDFSTDTPRYEIWGGDMNSLSFYDGGPASHFEDCMTLDDARKALAEWRKNYALVVWIQDKETWDVVE